jgi:cyclopropane-fatty-acyl-phospholipid synthase
MAAEKRTEGVRRLVAHVAQVAPIDLSLRLWDGSVLPLAPGARGDLVVAIAAPGALTRLVRRPRLTTVVELIAEGAVDLEGGTLLDLSARLGGGSTRGMAKRVDKLLAARTLLPFLFGPGRGGDGHAYAGTQAAEHGKGRDDKALVQFHYDLSNDFYALFLDPEMVYSCAYFPDWDADIATAQRAKLEMICRKLRLRPGQHMLDIGCGWGGLVCHAAQHHGVRAHGVTLSQAQHDFAQER